MQLIVQRVLSSEQIQKIQSEALKNSVPQSVHVDLERTGHPMSGTGMVFVFSGGSAAELKTAYEFWKGAIERRGFRTGMA